MKHLYFNILLLSVLMISCTKEENNTVRVITSGNQENYQHFYLNISSVQINYETGEGKTFWHILYFKEGVHDFANDTEWLLGSKNELPDGKIKQFRLVINEGSYFEKDGVLGEFENQGVEKIVPVDKPVTNNNVDLSVNISLEKSVVSNGRKLTLSPVFTVN